MKKKVDTEKQITSWASDLASKNETKVQEQLILSSYIQDIENHVYFPKAMISLEKNLRDQNNICALSKEVNQFYFKVVEVNQRKAWMVGLIV
ncbi:lactococcin-B immunity protein [Lactococcus lactis]|uniref:lactococcin-B immunity protein n=1 Tax=Lactococcus lactis TaxID=1358 RepID=UPI0022E26EBE|nr:lactococcin-B immunity protein [Lactococcus lactis]